MTQIQLERHIAAPPERVFAAASDLRRAPEFIRAITRLEVLTDGPIRAGTRFRETRTMFKREATEEMEITAFDPPRGYTVGCDSHGSRYRTEFRFEPAAGGTQATMTFAAELQTFTAKVMSVVFGWMMKSVMKECAKDLDDIKAHVEGGAA